MSPGRIPWNPDRKTLVEFSRAGFVVLGLIAGPSAFWRGDVRAAEVFVGIGMLLGFVGIVWPRGLRWPFVVASVVTWPIGLVVSQVTLAILYFGLFTPIALFFRLIGRDVLKRRRDTGAATYWEEYHPDQGAERYFRTY